MSKGENSMCIQKAILRLAAGAALFASQGCTPALQDPSDAPPSSVAAEANEWSNPAPIAAESAGTGYARMGTRSIAACDPATSECGIAVVSFPSGTPAVVPVGEPGVAIANQAWPNIYTARAIVQAVLAGSHPTAAIEAALTADPNPAIRQFAVAALSPDLPSGVAVATFAGDHIPREYCTLTGDTYSVVADGQTSSGVCQAMADGFEAAHGSLSRRLLAALKAGAAAGGDSRGEYSAAIRVYQNTSIFGQSGVSLIGPDASVDRASDWQGELEFNLNAFIAVVHEEYAADRVPLTSEMAQDILSVLRELGYYNGRIDRGWTSSAEQALRRFGSYNCFFPRGTVEAAGQRLIDGVLAAYIVDGHRRGVLRAQ
jgi:uncharacterized Ntn-hydrolase superfamily protein